MNKENDLTSKLEDLNLSSKPRRLTRSASIRHPIDTLKVENSKPNIKLERKVSRLNITNENEKQNVKLERKQSRINKHDNKPKNVLQSVNEIIETDNIVGRQSEKMQITNFLVNHFDNFINANLYISGSPGTGKTALVTSILASLKSDNQCLYHMTTCMDFSQATGVFPDIWNKLSGHDETNAERAASKIENFLHLRKKEERPLVIVLDEVDQLISNSQRILYRIFKWVEISNSRLIIIGIANTLDLTESKLPDMILENYRPHHINFPPYTQSELEAIIMSRVTAQLTPAERQGVTLCSKKVSGKSGDARVALELYKRAAAISEGDQLSLLKSELAETSNVDHTFRTPMKNVISTPQLLSMRRAQIMTPSSPSIKHVSRAIKETEKISDPYKHIVNADTGESALPLHHKLVLCAALVLTRQKKKKAMTLGELCNVYVSVCASQDIGSLDMSELVNICDLLDTRALMKVRPHKEVRQRTFTLNLDANGIESALADNSLLTSILSKFCP